MQEFDYIIIGAGCSGLSLVYEMDKKNYLTIKLVQFLIKEKILNAIKYGLIGILMNIHSKIVYLMIGVKLLLKKMIVKLFLIVLNININQSIVKSFIKKF
jgi:hypothetical protein